MGNMKSMELFTQLFRALEEVHRTLDMQTCQEKIVASARELCQAKGASLMLFNPGDESLRMSKSAGLSRAYVDKGPVNAAKSLGEAKLGETVVAKVESDPNIQYREAAAREGIRSIVGIPLSGGNMLMGTLRLYREEAEPPEAELLAIMEGFSQQAGLALRKCFYFSSLKDYTSEINGRPAPLEFAQTVELLLDTAARGAQAKGCALWLLDRESGNLEAVGSVGLSPGYLAKGPISARRSLGEVTTGEPVVISRVQENSGVQYPHQAVEEGIEAIIGLPIWLGGRVVGGLRFYYEFEFNPDEDDLVWMGHMTRAVGMALERDRLLIKLKEGHDKYQDLMDDLEAKFYR